MRGVGRCAVVMLAALGCSAANPAYDEPRSSTSGEATDTGPADDTSAGEPSTGEPEDRCELHEDVPLGLQIREGTTVIAPDCTPGNNLYSSGVGRLVYPPPSTFQFAGCSDAACVDCQGGDVFFDFRDTLDNPPALPNCGRVIAWAAPGRNGCEWQGLLMQEGDSLLPFFIASNQRAPLPLMPFEVGLESKDLCDGQCIGAGPGTYELVFFDDHVSVENSPQTVDIDFANGGVPYPYEVVNRMSSVNEQCQEQVSWTARRLPD